MSGTRNSIAITGDETGLLKLIDTNESGKVCTYGEQDRSNAVKGLSWFSTDSFAVGRANGAVEQWGYGYSEDEGHDLVLLHTFGVELDNIVNITSIPQLSGDGVSMLAFSEEGECVMYNMQSGEGAEPTTFSVRGPLSCCVSAHDSRALFGGKENDAIMYDLNTTKEVWKAKNVNADFLHLRVPVWITDMALLNAEGKDDGSHFVTGTGYKQVRVYDIKAGQQPVQSFEIGDEYRVTKILPFCNKSGQQMLYVGDTVGGLTLWDVRMMRRLNTLKSSAGAIRDIQIQNDGQRVASVSLDRFLRVYNTEKNSVVSSTYLKNRLNRVLFVPRSGGNGSDADSADAEESDYDSDFDGSHRHPKKRTKVANPNKADSDILELLNNSGDDDEDEDEEEDEEEEDDDDDDVEEEDDDDDEEEEVEEDDDNDDDGEDDDEEEDDDDEEEEKEPPRRSFKQSTTATAIRSSSKKTVPVTSSSSRGRAKK